jgi:chromosome segregation ATPase
MLTIPSSTVQVRHAPTPIFIIHAFTHMAKITLVKGTSLVSGADQQTAPAKSRGPAMRIDDLPTEFEAFLERARTIFGREIDKARKALAVLKADEATTQRALTTAQAQLNQARADLTATNADLGKASDLVSLRYETAELRREVEKLTAEKSALTAEVADLAKKKGALEAEVAGLADDARMYRAEKADTEAYFDRARAFANNWRTTQ